MKVVQIMRRVKDKETSGCHRYSLQEGERTIDTIYVRKSALRGLPPPERLRVTIEEEEA